MNVPVSVPTDPHDQQSFDVLDNIAAIFNWMTWVAAVMLLVGLVVLMIKSVIKHNEGHESFYSMYIADLFHRPTPEEKAEAAKQELADNFTKLRLNTSPNDWPWLDEQAELVGLRLTPKRKYEVAP